LVLPAGLEPDPQSSGKQALDIQSGTDSGTPADAGALETLAAALAKLSAEDRARLAAVLLDRTPGSPEAGLTPPDSPCRAGKWRAGRGEGGGRP